MTRPDASIVYTCWACCDTLTKTVNAHGEPLRLPMFSRQPHFDLDFTLSDARRHLSGKCHYHLIAREKQTRRFYVAFKGTETLKDALCDLQVYPSFELGAGTAHAGFASRANQIRSVESIVKLLNEGAEVVVTGYSMGGAVALLVLFKILNDDGALPQTWLRNGQLQCITFGAPYVGNERFSQGYSQFEPMIHNFVNGGDIVPQSLSKSARESYPILSTLLCMNDYTPIGTFHRIDFDAAQSRYTMRWNAEAPRFTALRPVEQVQDHIFYYQSLLQALGDPTGLVAIQARPVSLAEVCPAITQCNVVPLPASVQVFGRNLHTLYSSTVDGEPGESTPERNTLSHVAFPLVRETAVPSFRFKSDLPFHVEGSTSDHEPYSHLVESSQGRKYISGPERSKEMTVSQLLSGLIAMGAVQSFTTTTETTARSAQSEFVTRINEYLENTVAKNLLADVWDDVDYRDCEKKSFKIISVAAIQQLHAGKPELSDRVFERHPMSTVIGITDPPLAKQYRERLGDWLFSRDTIPIQDTTVVDLIRDVGKAYPGTIPRVPGPVPVLEALSEIAAAGKKYRSLVRGAMTPDSIQSLDALETDMHFHIQCLQCTWMEFSLNLYWRPLLLSKTSEEQNLLDGLLKVLTFGTYVPKKSVDYGYIKRVVEMAKALDVLGGEVSFQDLETRVSKVDMPDPTETQAWAWFALERKALEPLDTQLSTFVYSTWRLIKAVTEVRGKWAERFIGMVCGTTKAGKGTLLHKAFKAESQFGSDLNTICPRMFDCTQEASQWGKLKRETPRPSLELVDMPSINDAGTLEGRNNFQLTHQLCPFLSAVVVLLKATEINDKGVNQLLESVNKYACCKVLLAIGYLEVHWGETNTTVDVDPYDDLDDPVGATPPANPETQTVQGAKRAAVSIWGLLEKLRVATWGSTMDIVLTDVRYLRRRDIPGTTLRKYDELIKEINSGNCGRFSNGEDIKYFSPVEIRQWVRERYIEHCGEYGLLEANQ